MSRRSALLFLPLVAAAAPAGLPAARFAAAPPSATAAATPGASSAVPASWFEKNVIVTSKNGYVHVFWNAQEARVVLQGPRKRGLLALAARKLAAERIKSGADAVKMDVVFVRERDGYGMPRWDTLEKIAHLEFSRTALLQGVTDGVAPEKAQMDRIFTVFEVR